jgi:hypothetical protein
MNPEEGKVDQKRYGNKSDGASDEVPPKIVLG